MRAQSKNQVGHPSDSHATGPSPLSCSATPDEVSKRALWRQLARQVRARGRGAVDHERVAAHLRCLRPWWLGLEAGDVLFDDHPISIGAVRQRARAGGLRKTLEVRIAETRCAHRRRAAHATAGRKALQAAVCRSHEALAGAGRTTRCEWSQHRQCSHDLNASLHGRSSLQWHVSSQFLPDRWKRVTNRAAPLRRQRREVGVTCWEDRRRAPDQFVVRRWRSRCEMNRAPLQAVRRGEQSVIGVRALRRERTAAGCSPGEFECRV